MRDNLAHADQPYFYTTHVRVSPEAEIFVSVADPLGADENTPTVLYMAGYRDDMTNVKCLTAQEAALSSGASFVTLDYRGHGQSLGKVRNESLRSYRDDARAVLNEVIPDRKNLVLAGHSIGSLNAIFLAHEIEKEDVRRVHGLVGIATVSELMSKDRLGYKVYKRAGRQELADTGEMTNRYAPSLVYSRAFLHEYQKDNLSRPCNRRMLNDIRAPIHLVVAESDAFSPLPIIEAMKREFRSATLETCPNGKHIPGSGHIMEDETSLALINQAVRTAVARTAAHPALALA